MEEASELRVIPPVPIVVEAGFGLEFAAGKEGGGLGQIGRGMAVRVQRGDRPKDVVAKALWIGPSVSDTKARILRLVSDTGLQRGIQAT